MKHTRQRRGFTLVEVLVALALVAATLGGVLTLARGAIANQEYLERRLFADWVARNILAAWRLEPGTENQSGHEVVLGRDFSWTLTVGEPTPLVVADDGGARDDTMMERTVEVTVSDGTAGAAPLARRRFARREPAS